MTQPVWLQHRFGEKEAYMAFMNSFLEDHGPAMQHFLDQVAMVDANATPSGYQGSGDLALQLAALHVQLCTIFAELDQVWPESQNPGCRVERQEG